MIVGDQKKSFDFFFLLELVSGNGKKEDPMAGHQPFRVPAFHFPQAVPRGPSALSGGSLTVSPEKHTPAPAQRFLCRSSVWTFSEFLQPEHLGLRYQPSLSRFRYRWPSDQQDLLLVEALFLGKCSTQAPRLLRLQPEDYTSQHAQQKEGVLRRSAPRDYSLWLHCIVAGCLVVFCDLALVCGRVIVSRPRHAKNQISNDPAGESCSVKRRVPSSLLRSEAPSPRAAVGGGLSLGVGGSQGRRAAKQIPGRLI